MKRSTQRDIAFWLGTGSQIAGLLGSLFQFVDQQSKAKQAKDTWSRFQGRLEPMPTAVPETPAQPQFTAKMPVMPGMEGPAPAMQETPGQRRPVTEDDLLWLMGTMPQGYGGNYLDLAKTMYDTDTRRSLAEQQQAAALAKAMQEQQLRESQYKQKTVGDLLSGLFGMIKDDQQINPNWGSVGDAVNAILQTGAFPEPRRGMERRSVDPRTTPTLTGYEDVESLIPMLIPDAPRERYQPAGTFSAGGDTYGAMFNTGTGEYATQLLETLKGAKRVGQERARSGGGGRSSAPGSKPLSLNQQQEKATLEAQIALKESDIKNMQADLAGPVKSLDPNWKIAREERLKKSQDELKVLKAKHSVYAQQPTVNTPEEQKSRSTGGNQQWWK